ncbi:hypothetical protein BH10PAT3_BH10PAT3_2000 [soil metagenome]
MDEVRKLVEDIRFKAHDYCQNSNHPDFEEFKRDLENFLSEIKQDQTADKLEWKMKDIEHIVQRFKANEEVFKFQDTDDLHDRCEVLRKVLQELARQ